MIGGEKKFFIECHAAMHDWINTVHINVYDRKSVHDDSKSWFASLSFSICAAAVHDAGAVVLKFRNFLLHSHSPTTRFLIYLSLRVINNVDRVVSQPRPNY